MPSSRKPISLNTLRISRETVIIHSNANNTSEFCKNKQKDHHKHICRRDACATKTLTKVLFVANIKFPYECVYRVI